MQDAFIGLQALNMVDTNVGSQSLKVLTPNTKVKDVKVREDYTSKKGSRHEGLGAREFGNKCILCLGGDTKGTYL
jgi:hypothetical protein